MKCRCKFREWKRPSQCELPTSAEKITKLPVRPPLVSDHLLSATTFPKYQNFLSQITMAGTSGRRPPLVGNCDHILRWRFEIVHCLVISGKRPLDTWFRLTGCKLCRVAPCNPNVTYFNCRFVDTKKILHFIWVICQFVCGFKKINLFKTRWTEKSKFRPPVDWPFVSDHLL